MEDEFTSDRNVQLLWELITSFNIEKEKNISHFEKTIELVRTVDKSLIEKNKLFIQIFTNKLIDDNNLEEDNYFGRRIQNRNVLYDITNITDSSIISNNLKKEIKGLMKTNK